MTISSGVASTYKRDLLLGVHNFSTDVIKAALVTSAANYDPATATVYSSGNGEAVGTNYPAGGLTLPLATGFPKVDPGTGFGVVDFDPATITNCTVTFRGIVIYNSSKSNKVIQIMDRGVDVNVINGDLVLSNSGGDPHLIKVI